MSSVSSAAPSARALRQLTNRNNLAELQMREHLALARRLMTVRITDLDKDRLDVADFLANVKRCDSDDLPQSKRVREELDKEDINDLSDSSSSSPTLPDGHPRRHNTHTAKTAPTPSTRRRRRRGHGDGQDDKDDGDDRLSLDQHPLRRHVKNGAQSRREMLRLRHESDERAKVSDHDKAELLLAKLREEGFQEQVDSFQQQATRRSFVAYILSKTKGRGLDTGSEEEEEDWAGGGGGTARMVYPIKRLGNIAARFKRQQVSGGNTPVEGLMFSPRRKPPPPEGGRRRDGGRAGEGRRGKPTTTTTSSSSFSRRGAQPRPPPPPPPPRSVFEITDEDPPASALPRPACMPDANRPRRDLLADVARAYGFGEAAVLPLTPTTKPGGKITPPQDTTINGLSSPPPPQFNPLSRKSIAERRRLQRQAKVKVSVHLKLPARPAADAGRGSQGPDSVRALLRARLGSQRSLEDRIKEFIRDLDDMDERESWPDSER